MSLASDRKAIREILPEYALLSLPELGRFLGVSEEVARDMVDSKAIPSVRVGQRRMVDPMDAVVYVLAEREGITAAAYWELHGEQTAELARKYVARIRRMVA